MKCPSPLPNFNHIWNILTDFHKYPKYQISWKSIQWEPSLYMHTHEHTDGHYEDNRCFSQFCKHPLKQTRKKSKEKVKRKNKNGKSTNQVLIMANAASWQTVISQVTLHILHISNRSSMGNYYFLNPNPQWLRTILSPLTAFHICDRPNFLKSSYKTHRIFFIPVSSMQSNSVTLTMETVCTIRNVKIFNHYTMHKHK